MAIYRQLFIIFFTLCTSWCLLDGTATNMHSVCYSDATSLSKISINEGLTSREISLSDYRGKALLIVNTASFCTYTHQYPHLNKLKTHYGDQLAILGVPSDQFGLQEPGNTPTEIHHCLRYVRPGNGYSPNFPLTEKVNVNGPNEHVLYTKLKDACPPVKLEIGDPKNLYWSPMKTGDITWNFNKFLLDRDGVPFKRYDSPVMPEEIKTDIDTILLRQQGTVRRPVRPNYA